jgi:hypothetical protein
LGEFKHLIKNSFIAKFATIHAVNTHSVPFINKPFFFKSISLLKEELEEDRAGTE